MPLIARRPGAIEAGGISSRPVVGTDLPPTFAEVASLSFPAGIELDGRPEQRRERMIWHFPYYQPEKTFDESLDAIGLKDGAISKTYPQSAIRVGNHKLIYFFEDQRVELYDLEADPSESNDLATVEPDRAKVMTAQLLGELRARNARLPTKNR